MGYADRDWARGALPGRIRIIPWIIGLTVACWLVQGFGLGRGGLDLSGVFGVVPERLVESGWLWQLFTHALLHQPHSIMHLVFNMLFLWFLGPDVAARTGLRRFMLLYLGGAAACALAFTVAGYASGVTGIPAIGASGAIFAVSVVAAFYFPGRRFLFMLVVPVPLWVLVGLYVGIDLYYPVAGLRPWMDSAGHLGGALFGLLFFTLNLDLPAFRNPFRKSVPTASEVDRILGKISSGGIGSLNEREREILKRASERG